MKPYTDIEQSRLSTMTQEEKAKRFDEAFRLAKEQHQYPWVRKSKDVLEEIFPELRESEDEKIRKWLIGTIKQIPDDSIEWETICKSDVLAWLDRPSEEKPDDKFEPKFHEGDWVVQENIGVYKVIEICESWYEVVDGEDNHYSISFDNEYMCRLWDITKDANEGDVLYDGNAACIFRKTMEDDDAIWVDTYCGINIDNEFKVNDEDECWCLSEDCSPATKEQRDALMKAMAAAGYEFDFEKKELKKIEDEPTQAIEFYDPYEAVVKSIAEMCKRYDRMDLGSLQDFYDNVKVKCKDAQEYVSLYPQNAKD